jgi:metal-responsive CopG/Arc/MetJ family transcriptional regulator
VTRRRIQPKPTLELETVSLRLPAQLVRAVEQYAKYLGGRTDRSYVIAQAIEITLAQDADFQKSLTSRVDGPLAGPART